MKQPIALFWFRNDLRLLDNPALFHIEEGKSVLPIYIWDETRPDGLKAGGASRFWLMRSLIKLQEDLKGSLSFFKGDPLFILQDLCRRHEIQEVFWNESFEPFQSKQDQKVQELLRSASILMHSFNGSLLWDPRNVKTAQGSLYKVFTPFFKKGCLNAIPPRKPFPKTEKKWFYDPSSLKLQDLPLYSSSQWHHKMDLLWTAGEAAALKVWEHFLDQSILSYKNKRDFPFLEGTSKLSSALHFGEISPHLMWHEIQTKEPNDSTLCFMKELGWREFAHYTLFHFPELPRKNFQPSFDNFSWRSEEHLLQAWKKGETGYPIVDAGMRELWQTGHMHNRVRMIVGSFLVKNLRIHWREGQKWFWDCLLDADLANNAFNWQWITGCGCDAAPYFRIFNPITQAQKFDPEGRYIRHYIPELKDLPIPFLFAPWTVNEKILRHAKIILGKTYPYPIVDLDISRKEALEAFKRLR